MKPNRPGAPKGSRNNPNGRPKTEKGPKIKKTISLSHAAIDALKKVEGPINRFIDAAIIEKVKRDANFNDL